MILLLYEQLPAASGLMDEAQNKLRSKNTEIKNKSDLLNPDRKQVGVRGILFCRRQDGLTERERTGLVLLVEGS